MGLRGPEAVEFQARGFRTAWSGLGRAAVWAREQDAGAGPGAALQGESWRNGQGTLPPTPGASVCGPVGPWGPLRSQGKAGPHRDTDTHPEARLQ